MHINEKEKERELKQALKENEDPSVILASSDLEQVLHLPKTHRCEVFYRRRLSIHNFTILDLKSKACRSYLWHEGLGKRGSNEIASCVFDFLGETDSDGCKHVCFVTRAQGKTEIPRFLP